MKKLLTIILAGVLATSLYACSSETKETNNTAGTETTQTSTENTNNQAEDTSNSDIIVVDMRNTLYEKFEQFFECDEYTLSMINGYPAPDEYSPQTLRFSYIVTNKTDKTIYGCKWDYNEKKFEALPGDRCRVNDDQPIAIVEAAGIHEVLVVPIDENGNEMQKVKLIFAYGDDADYSQIVYNTVLADTDDYRVVLAGITKTAANVLVENKSDCELDINFMVEKEKLAPGESRTIEGVHFYSYTDEALVLEFTVDVRRGEMQTVSMDEKDVNNIGYPATRYNVTVSNSSKEVTATQTAETYTILGYDKFYGPGQKERVLFD